jgi:DNA-binding CsgD family transcriptional regulator
VSLSVPSMGGDLGLVGRDDSLDFLERGARAVSAGRFRVFLVSGSGGVGKTRLVAEVMERCADDVTRISARSFRWGGTTSFGPWVEAVDAHLRARPIDDVRQLCGSAIEALAAIVPSARLAHDGLAPEPNRDRLLDALAQLFDRMSQEAPVLVAFDDFHLADSSAWEALRYLGRRLADAPIGIFATARPSPTRSHPIASEVLLGLEDDGILVRVDLEPLRRADVAALAHAALQEDARARSTFVPEPLVEWLMSRSLGYPLFVIGLLRALLDDGADLADPRLDQTPHKISERVALDLHALDPGDREVLEILAIVEQRCDLGLLSRFVDRPVSQIGTSLEALNRAQLVAAHGEGSNLRYEIVHPIVQDVIYEEVGSSRRGVLHHRAAHLMLDLGNLGAAASHFARSAIQGDDEAVDALLRAMEQASRRDLYREALAVMGTLLEVLPAGDPRWIRVLDSVPLNSEWVLSHLAETSAGIALEAMNRVVEVAESTGDLFYRASARFHLAALLSFGEARFEEAEAAAQEAVELFRRAGQMEAELIAVNELAWIAGLRGDFARNLALATEAFDRASTAGLSHIAAVATGTAGFAGGIAGQCQLARHHFEQAVDLARRAGASYRVAWAHSMGPHYSMAACGDLQSAVSWGEQALADDPAAPDALAFENLAFSYWLEGRLEAAVTTVERSAVYRPILGSRRRAWGSALAARLYGERGQRARAMSSIDRARSTYSDHFLAFGVWIDWTDGVLAWFEGRYGESLERLMAVQGWLQTTEALVYEPLVLADIAEISADAGDVEVCERARERSRAIVDGRDCALARWVQHLTSAQVHRVLGETRQALWAGDRAASGFDDAGYSMLGASSRWLMGEALVGSDREAATEMLAQAAKEFDECGAVWRRDRVLGSLARLGARGRRAAAAVQGPESLSPRERQVAALTVRGHTAQEVGDALFIGKRTVETHLANVYAKLQVGSKRELVQRAADFNL